MSHEDESLDAAPRNVVTSDDADSVDSDTILPIRHNHTSRRSGSPVWSRRSVDSAHPQRPKTRAARWIQTARNLPRQAITTFTKLPLPQRIAVVLGMVIVNVLLILCIVYYSKILDFWAWCAKKYRDVPFGWLIMWAATFLVSFPPLIGYSTIVSLAGMVYGMAAWPIIASATILGSTASFVVSRGILRSYVERLTSKSKKFTALAMVLKHDGLKLLIMIRICPLPYSLANGVISTIPTVTWPNFMLATAIASPKLLLHIFVGSRIGDIAENGDKMDARTKIISWAGAIIGALIGIATGYVTYARTQARAKALEAEEIAAASTGAAADGFPAAARYIDDATARDEDNISLHPTHVGDDEVYGDNFTDEEDAVMRGDDDVFDLGDGYDDADDGVGGTADQEHPTPGQRARRKS